MHARDVAQPFPSVRRETSAVEAARLLAEQNLPGLVVVDGSDRPVSVLLGPDILRAALPSYCIDDPTLTRVIDEGAADLFARELGDRTVAQCIAGAGRDLPLVSPSATVLEVAAVMARTRSSLVVVADRGEPMIGVITLDGLLERVLTA
jgi:CBS domain-containing protein